jgi:hypothetical protein
MRNTRFGILEMVNGPDGKSVSHTVVPSSSRTRRAYMHLRRLKHAAPAGVKYRMLEEKLSTLAYPFTRYPTGGK